MATLTVDPVNGPYTTVQAAVTACTSADKVSIVPGTYVGNAGKFDNSANKDLWVEARDGPGTVILDGQGLVQIMTGYQANKKFTMKNITVRGSFYSNCRINNTGTGSNNYNTAQNNVDAASTYLLDTCIFEHCGQATTVGSGNANNWSIWANGGCQPIIQNCVIHHSGDTNEANGITQYFAYKGKILKNVCFNVRKDAIRHGYSYQGEVDSNICFMSWTGITSEFNIGSRFSNNLIYDCELNFYIKQSNNDTDGHTEAVVGTSPYRGIRTYWGKALNAAGLFPSWTDPTPAPYEYVAVIHNTSAAARFTCCSVATQWWQDYVYIANNCFVAVPITDTGGNSKVIGDTFIQDAGSYSSTAIGSPGTTSGDGDHVFYDYNCYVTTYATPPWWLVKGQPNPITNPTTGVQSFAAIQSWRSTASVPPNFEANGQVRSNVTFADVADRDFTITSGAISGGRNLTSNPINPLGSPYGAQVGCDTSLLPNRYATVKYVGPPTLVSVTSVAGSNAGSRAIDCRWMTFWTSAANPAVVGGVGANVAITVDYGSVKTFTEMRVSSQQSSSNQEWKTAKLEWTADDPASPSAVWNNALTHTSIWGYSTVYPGPNFTNPLSLQSLHLFECLPSVDARGWRFTCIDTTGDDQFSVSTFQGTITSPDIGIPPPPPPPPPPATVYGRKPRGV